MARDYAQCRELGFRTLRDGLRWHLIEKAPGKYDWSSWLPMLEAAEEAGGEEFLGEVVRESPGGNEETADRVDDDKRRGGVVKQGRELHA